MRGYSRENPEKSLAITFDDGYASFFNEVLPQLTERGIPATLFIITDFVGKENRWDLAWGVNRRRHLTWEEIRAVADAGIEIGSHTRTHRDLTRLPDDERQREIADARKIIEDKLGRKVTSLALPFGSGTADVFRAARKAGFEEICGGVPGIYGPLPGILPRLPVYRGDGKAAIRRKLEWHPLEIVRLKFLQSFSLATRKIKS